MCNKLSSNKKIGFTASHPPSHLLDGQILNYSCDTDAYTTLARHHKPFVFSRSFSMYELRICVDLFWSASFSLFIVSCVNKKNFSIPFEQIGVSYILVLGLIHILNRSNLLLFVDSML